jgi:hypothetical protein
VLAARQHESVGADDAARARNDDVDTEEKKTFWTRTRFQVPTERATIDEADIMCQRTILLSSVTFDLGKLRLMLCKEEILL